MPLPPYCTSVYVFVCTTQLQLTDFRCHTLFHSPIYTLCFATRKWNFVIAVLTSLSQQQLSFAKLNATTNKCQNVLLFTTTGHTDGDGRDIAYKKLYGPHSGHRHIEIEIPHRSGEQQWIIKWHFLKGECESEQKTINSFFYTRYYFDDFPFRLIGYLLELLTYVSVYSGTWCILWKP